MRTWPRASPREAIDGTEKREGETERKAKVHEGELMGQVRQEEGVKGGGREEGNGLATQISWKSRQGGRMLR